MAEFVPVDEKIRAKSKMMQTKMDRGLDHYITVFRDLIEITGTPLPMACAFFFMGLPDDYKEEMPNNTLILNRKRCKKFTTLCVRSNALCNFHESALYRFLTGSQRETAANLTNRRTTRSPLIILYRRKIPML